MADTAFGYFRILNISVSAVILGTSIATSISCSDIKNEDVEPYNDTDILDESTCADASTGDWPSDGGTPVAAFLGDGDELGMFCDQCELANDIAVLRDGSFVVVGSFNGEATFGKGQSQETTLRDDSLGTDGFIAKYTEQGELLWVKQLSGKKQLVSNSNVTDIADWVTNIDTFSDDSFVIRGHFTEKLILALGEPNETAIQGEPLKVSEFLAEYDRQGNLLWARVMSLGYTFQPSNIDDPLSSNMAVVNDHSFVAVGTFIGTVTFGPQQERVVQLSNNTGAGYITKWNRNGESLWAKPIIDEYVGHLVTATACSGRIYIAGKFERKEYYGEDVIGSKNGTFIAKYLPNGDLENKAVYALNTRLPAIDTFPDGQYVIAGYGAPKDSVIFPDTPEETNIGDINGALVITKISEDDRPLWTKTAKAEEVYSVTAVSDGSVIVTGRFHKKAVFGVGEENETVLDGYGNNDGSTDDWDYSDGFVARYHSDGRLAWAHAVIGNNSQHYYVETDAVRKAAIIEHSKKVVIAGQVWGDFSIDYGTEHQWPEGEQISPNGYIDWYVAILNM